MPQIPQNLPLINRIPAVPPERPLALAWVTKRFSFSSTAVAAAVAEMAFHVEPPR